MVCRIVAATQILYDFVYGKNLDDASFKFNKLLANDQGGRDNITVALIAN